MEIFYMCCLNVILIIMVSFLYGANTRFSDEYIISSPGYDYKLFEYDEEFYIDDNVLNQGKAEPKQSNWTSKDNTVKVADYAKNEGDISSGTNNTGELHIHDKLRMYDDNDNRITNISDEYINSDNIDVLNMEKCNGNDNEGHLYGVGRGEQSGDKGGEDADAKLYNQTEKSFNLTADNFTVNGKVQSLKVAPLVNGGKTMEVELRGITSDKSNGTNNTRELHIHDKLRMYDNRDNRNTNMSDEYANRDNRNSNISDEYANRDNRNSSISDEYANRGNRNISISNEYTNRDNRNASIRDEYANRDNRNTSMSDEYANRDSSVVPIMGKGNRSDNEGDLYGVGSGEQSGKNGGENADPKQYNRTENKVERILLKSGEHSGWKGGEEVNTKQYNQTGKSNNLTMDNFAKHGKDKSNGTNNTRELHIHDKLRMYDNRDNRNTNISDKYANSDNNVLLNLGKGNGSDNEGHLYGVAYESQNDQYMNKLTNAMNDVIELFNKHMELIHQNEVEKDPLLLTKYPHLQKIDDNSNKKGVNELTHNQLTQLVDEIKEDMRNYTEVLKNTDS